MERLTNATFGAFCAEEYDNPQGHTIEEFLEDVGRVKHIKRLITRYAETGELRERLILNHLIVLNNVFGPANLSRICFLKMRRQLRYVKPFLILLDALPPVVYMVGPDDAVYTDAVEMDPGVVDALRRI